MKEATWTAIYSVEQLAWQPGGAPKRGARVFFSTGVSDGNPNPVKYSYSLGLVGTGGRLWCQAEHPRCGAYRSGRLGHHAALDALAVRLAICG